MPYTEDSWQGLVSLCEFAGGGIKEGINSAEGGVRRAEGGVREDRCQQLENSSYTLSTPSGVEDASIMGVAALTLEAARALAGAFARPLWVVGEIQNLAFHNGHCYFTLAEPSGSSGGKDYTVSALIWRDRYQELESQHGAETLKGMLCDGVKVKVRAMVTLYRARGRLSLTVETLDPSYSQGELALAREKVVKELKRLGIFSCNKQLPFPFFPQKIGLISAAGSRAYSDFIHQLGTSPLGLTVLFCSATMQGASTSKEVRRALKVLCGEGCDVICITRGGGSAADLHSFNDFELARSVTCLDVPVLVAIGHHEDECALQDVAHQGLKTPTALADYLLHHFFSMDERLEDLQQRILALLESAFERHKLRLDQLSHTLYSLLSSYYHDLRAQLDQRYHELFEVFSERMRAHHKQLSAFEARFSWQISHHRQRQHHQHHQLVHSFTSSADSALGKLERSLADLEKKLEVCNPLPWIEEGWSPLMRGSKRLKSIKDIKKGDHLHLALKDGGVKSQVLSLHPFSHKESSL